MTDTKKNIDLLKIASSSYKITIESANEQGRKVLFNIIKDCLENDYSFRTLFAGSKIIIDDKTVDNKDLVSEYNEIKKTNNE